MTRRILDAYRRFAGLEPSPAAPRTAAPGRPAPAAPPPAEPEAPRATLPMAALAEPAPPAPAPRLPHPSALGGIAMLHTEHDARARRLNALHRAQVAVLGTPPTGEAEFAAILRRCGGRLVSSDDVRPTVWLAGDDVAPERVAALRRIGCVVVDAEGLTALAGSTGRRWPPWFREAVAAAIYRLRLLQRAMLLVREEPRPAADLPRRAPDPVEHGPRAAAARPRRVQRPRTAPRRVPPPRGRRSPAEELAASIEAAARARRSANPGCGCTTRPPHRRTRAQPRARSTAWRSSGVRSIEPASPSTTSFT